MKLFRDVVFLVLFFALLLGSGKAQAPSWHGLFTTNAPAVDTTVPAITDDALKAEFIFLFGPQPQRRDYATFVQYAVANSLWSQKAKYFGGIVDAPENITLDILANAASVFRGLGVPEPVFYQDRYGVNALFRGEVVLDTFGRQAVLYPEHQAARYHVESIRAGFCVPLVHPFVPSSLKQENARLCE